MTNFKEIETYLKHGIHVSIKNTKGNYLIISPLKFYKGIYRTSGFWEVLKDAKQNIGMSNGYINLEEKCKDWTEITPFHLDFEPYPVGMKVKVIETGQVAEIGDTRFKSMYILKDFLMDYYSHTELIPYFEEPTITLTDDELLAECERRGVSTKIVS